MVIGDLLRQPARRLPDKTALIVGDRRMTFRELDEEADRVASALMAMDLPARSTIAIRARNCHEYAAVYFGIARAGHVSANVSLKVTTQELRFMLEKVRARVLIVSADFEPAADGPISRLAALQRIVVIDGEPRASSGQRMTYGDFIADRTADYPAVSIDASDPLAITFTGGTTGFPKGVLVSHRARVVTAETVLVLCGLDETDRVCVSTPLFHAAGLFVVFTPPIWLGCTVTLLPQWDPELFMQTVERDGITQTLLVPSQLSDLVSHPNFSAKRLDTLNNIGYAGAPMSRALFERIRSAIPHADFIENYGQTETGPITVRCPWHPAEKVGTVGRPSFNVEVKVVDTDGKAVAPGEIGEIVTRGDHVFSEYFDEPEQTAQCFRSADGWLWTGDLGFIDEDGFVSVVDRSKDMLISGGENIYPAEIENALYQHPAVAECAVFGIPDDHWGEVPAAHVVLTGGATVAEDELIAFSTTFIARHKRPRLIEFVDALPRTAVGKIQKNVIREPYWQGRDRKI